MNPREVIVDNVEGPTESIDVKNTTLWEKLIELKLFTSGDAQNIKASRITIFLDFVQKVETLF